MGIKIVEESKVANARKTSGKHDLLTADIQEIIECRVEFCELTDFPYSEKTSLSSIQWTVDHICRKEFYNITKKGIDENFHPIILRRVKDESGTVHVYAKFLVNAWDRRIKEVTE